MTRPPENRPEDKSNQKRIKRSRSVFDTLEILPGLRPLHMQRLLEVGRSLGSTLDLPEILKMVLGAAAELTNSAGASILLLEPNGTELRFVASSQHDALLHGQLVPVTGSLAGWVVSESESVVIDDVTKDERHFATPSRKIGVEIQNLMAVPLRNRGKVIGVLEAYNKKGNKKEESKYTRYDQAVGQALASQAAMSIVNASLFSQADAIAETMHEIKTPLMAMTAATDLLEMENLSAEQRSQVLKTLKRETRRLTRMTQDFLILSRLDSGRFPLDMAEIDPVELAQAALDTLEAQAKQQRIGLSLMDKAGGAQIMGDVGRLHQVLINLISNGIKFNRPDGKVALKVSAATDEVTISVMDTGRGISPADLEKLFERFYRVENPSDVTEGTGLGLSIAKKLVEAHNGRIEVESLLGKGSAFHCIFPIVNPVKSPS